MEDLLNSVSCTFASLSYRQLNPAPLYDCYGTNWFLTGVLQVHASAGASLVIIPVVEECVC